MICAVGYCTENKLVLICDQECFDDDCRSGMVEKMGRVKGRKQNLNVCRVFLILCRSVMRWELHVHLEGTEKIHVVQTDMVHEW